ncbi:MAG: GreA/GreB family elongation factor [Candidatus Buchananbacteria bacterium]|nr:GreA/GreB family elongation factor [Candidatus Buchananbacteria bacterium]
MIKKGDKIKVGDTVLVVLNGEVKRLEIVELPQGDPKKGVISYLSPIAKAILGHSYPDRVTVKLPNGNTLECELLEAVTY